MEFFVAKKVAFSFYVGGVDSNCLAEVVADYFCGDSNDSDRMFS